MTLAVELDVPEPQTGRHVYDWLEGQFSQEQSRTGQPFPADLKYTGPTPQSDSARGFSLHQFEDVTDPNAQKRIVQPTVDGLVQNLAKLSAVATLIIPGLRDMTTKEQANLRQYYKTIYRKV